jgi:hypothetical protein
MALDHRPAGPSPLGTARGTLHAYRHARKLTHINSGDASLWSAIETR